MCCSFVAASDFVAARGGGLLIRCHSSKNLRVRSDRRQLKGMGCHELMCAVLSADAIVDIDFRDLDFHASRVNQLITNFARKRVRRRCTTFRSAFDDDVFDPEQTSEVSKLDHGTIHGAQARKNVGRAGGISSRAMKARVRIISEQQRKWPQSSEGALSEFEPPLSIGPDCRVDSCSWFVDVGARNLTGRLAILRSSSARSSQRKCGRMRFSGPACLSCPPQPQNALGNC
jgi:hypothetical protein